MTLPLHTAQLLHSWGCVPIVVPFASKKPAMLEWQRTPMPAAESLPALFGRAPCNVGVLLGAPSRNLVDIDLDCAEAIAMAPFFLPATITFGRASRRCSHYFFGTKGYAARSAQFRDGDVMLVEQRSTGLQTICPGSVGGDAELVQWDADCEYDRPVLVDREDLHRRVSTLAAAVLLARRCGPSAARGVAGALTAGNRPFRDIEAFLVAMLGGTDEAFDAAARPGQPWEGVDPKVAAKVALWLHVAPPPVAAAPARLPAARPADVLSRARKWVERVPGAVQGEGGNHRTYRVALALVRGFCLTEDGAMTLLREFNQRCRPPWTEADLLAKVKSAAASTSVETGYLLRRTAA